MSKQNDLRRNADILRNPNALAQIGSAIVKSAIERIAEGMAIPASKEPGRKGPWDKSWVKSPKSGWKDYWSNWKDKAGRLNMAPVLAKVNLDPQKIRLTAAEKKLLKKLDLATEWMPPTATKAKRKKTLR